MCAQRSRTAAVWASRLLLISAVAATLVAAAPAGPASPFVGHWEALDVDGSDIRLAVGGPPSGPFQITWTESYISFCNQEAGIVRGTGWLNESDPYILEANLTVECFTTGASIEFQADFRYHPTADTLSLNNADGSIMIWHRAGNPAILPAPLALRVNYGHDWLEGFYEAGHTVWIMITESDGSTVKGTAEFVTESKDFWGGQSGFQWVATPDPGPPDMEPYDWVFAWIDSGATAQVQLGDITGTIDLASDTVHGTVNASWFSEDPVDVECLAWWAPEPVPDIPFGSLAADGGTEYSCSWPEWDIQPEHEVGVAYVGPDGNWVANVFSVPYHEPRIVASAVGDFIWTTDFLPGAWLTFSVYASAEPGATQLWQADILGDDGGFAIIDYWGGLLDLQPGQYVSITDGTFTKGLLLEPITMDAFDPDTEVMAGTATPSRDVRVTAGGAAPESQGYIDTVADPVTGVWFADFDDIGFDITEDMRGWSFAQIFDDDGDANEADPPYETAQWLAAFTYDIPPGTLSEGTYSFHVEFEWTYPIAGETIDPTRYFDVSPAAPLYDGYVLLRREPLIGIETPDGLACEPVPAVHPDDESRAVAGWVTDYAMTYDWAISHFESMTARVVWADGTSVEMVPHEILPWASTDWPSYVCSFSR